MKRFLSLLILLSLLLSGCSITGERLKEPVTFYYLLREYQYGGDSCVIEGEEREASGHRQDLSYLLALYVMGPSDEHLQSPLPRSARILSTEAEGTNVEVNLTDLDVLMTDVDFSLACVCLSMTCLELTDAESITINSGSRSVTMNQDKLTLFDNGNTTVEETQ